MPYGRLLAVTLFCFAAGLALNASTAGAAGNTITSPDTTNTVGQTPSLALDGSIPVVAYYYNTSGDLKLVRCGDSSCSAGNTIRTPDSTGIVGQYTSMALDGLGRPVVAYFDSTNHALKVLHCGDIICSSGNTLNTVDSNTVGTQTSLVLDAQGKPAVSYYNGHLRVVRCGDVSCSAGNTFADPDTLGPVGFHSSITLDGNTPVVSYYDQKNGDLKVLRCGTSTCQSGNTITTPDTNGDVGEYISSVLDPTTGFPVIAYYDSTNGDLKVLHCGDGTCSSGNQFATPDTVGDVGTNVSIALDGSRNPVISYRDETNQHLKLIHCGNTTCTSGNSGGTVDNNGNVGFESSLALDSGIPVVAYYDQTHGDLKVLRCGNTNCKQSGSNGDTDGDGCPDVKEQQTAPGSQTSGGLRDYLNPWDYFNPTHDHQNRVDDVLKVVGQYFHDDDLDTPGTPPYAPGYNVDTDRTALGPAVWNLGPPNGKQRVDDVLAIVYQYFDDCS